jgi:hypothetical protein
MTTKLNTLGLIEVTSQRQADNGTQCFHDPITGCDYLSYESGYVRRKFQATIYRNGSYLHPHRIFPIYQLNKKRMVQRELDWMPGKFVECTERILEMSPDKRIDIISRAVVNYRKTLRRYEVSDSNRTS